MQLDSFTILVAGCSLLGLQGVLFTFMWARDRISKSLLWWGIPFVLGGAALAVYMRPNWENDQLAVVVGNAVRILALASLWQGLRVFQHRKPLLWPMLAIMAVWLGFCLVPPFEQSLAARIVIVSLLNALTCGLAAHELWRNRSETLLSRWPTMIVFCSFAALMLLRGGLAGIAPFPVGAMPLDSAWLGAFMLLVFAHLSFAAVLFIAMTKERREAEQRNFAMSDPLTGLLNRRAFSDFAERINRRRAGLHSATALLVLDLDHFKSVNDQFGHEIGDRMLKAFADVAEASVRPTDQLFRMGGEEFCFVLPETSLADAIAVAERIRRTFEATVLETGSGSAGATVSVGIAATHFAVEIEMLLAAADAAVYEAKSRGRNRVVVAEPATLLRSPLADIVAPARLSA